MANASRMYLWRWLLLAGLILALAIGVAWVLLGKEKAAPDLAGERAADALPVAGDNVPKTLPAVPPSAETGVPNEQLQRMSDSLLGPKEVAKARMSLEKTGRAPGPSGAEKTREHQAKMQIPEAELDGLSTAGLVERTLGTSLNVLLLEGSSPDGGLGLLAGTYNGAAALLKRKDAGPELIKYYEAMIQKIPATSRATDKETLVETGKFQLRFPVVETLMSSPQVLDTLEEAQTKQVVGLVIKSLDAQADFDSKVKEPVFGQSTLEWEGLLVAKCLDRLHAPAYQEWFKQKEATGLFVTRPMTPSEGKEVIQIGRRFVAKE